jgi:hypothetical protein
MDQAPYFRKWLDEFRPQMALAEADKVSALEFFRQYQGQVSEWCRSKNLFSYTLDDRMSPNMLPYSSFLWQWCAQKLNDAKNEELYGNDKLSSLDCEILKTHYESLLKNIRLPSGRAQNDMIECWGLILRHQYIEFQFQ